VAIVNQEFARLFFKGDALGQRALQTRWRLVGS